ncbi:MAG: HAD family hydrolase [Oscillospiraceae bacterium]|jgi:hydroxymethylpyrimidine pyrophosphatase-like HAD family hydrolase|nr:HAD family hydrolase [Oscillospiraceae bacterium]
MSSLLAQANDLLKNGGLAHRVTDLANRRKGKLILIMHRTATKWNAIQADARRFNIPTANIAAFGDDYNDIEMLKNCADCKAQRFPLSLIVKARKI